MKPASAKAKGRTLQKAVAAALRAIYPELTDDDVKSTGMGQSGPDVQLSQAAKKLIPWDIECKNTERLNVWQALSQLSGRRKDGLKPVLIFKRNRSTTYACVELDYLLELLYDNEKN